MALLVLELPPTNSTASTRQWEVCGWWGGVEEGEGVTLKLGFKTPNFEVRQPEL